MKTCRNCRRQKPLTEFNRKGLRADGSIKRQTDCRECTALAHRERRKMKSVKVSDGALDESAMQRAKREAALLWGLRHSPRPLQILAKESGVHTRTAKRILGELRQDGIVDWSWSKGGWYLEDVA